ncbi:hypothetical protein Cantr_00788 [Candida viswanathii]|uniref:Uncharacterized protein n=1 Tax=Candida viswanathii TaxID=5486 RepID=A0A367YG87_9ASCO|nr:hypothetical protein Cantr_00788 [Candida viswanathii]
MSDELAQEAENLVRSTSILSHKYGIPAVEPNQAASNIKELEQKYYTLYKSLNHKLNKLMYLNKIQEIQDLSQDQIAQQVNSIKEKMGISDSAELLDFLKLQNSEIKTDRLLLNYLLMAKPILKSIHQSELNSSEQNILSMLNELYDEDKGLIYRYKDDEFDRQNYDLITKVIKPLVEKSAELNRRLKELNRKYVANKEEIIRETAANEGAKRKQFYELVKKWDKLQKMCLEIPEQIIELPIDWYGNPDLLSIMQQVDEIQIKLNKYDLIINKDTVSMFTTTELLALEYPE